MDVEIDDIRGCLFLFILMMDGLETSGRLDLQCKVQLDIGLSVEL